MAKVFLDANYLIDLLENRQKFRVDDLGDHDILISILSVHIYTYISKLKIPDKQLSEAVDKFTIVEFTRNVCYKALEGPTSDFEDNVQLHSAASAEADLFLTNDKRLLGIKFFGKTKILRELIN